MATNIQQEELSDIELRANAILRTNHGYGEKTNQEWDSYAYPLFDQLQSEYEAILTQLEQQGDEGPIRFQRQPKKRRPNFHVEKMEIPEIGDLIDTVAGQIGIWIGFIGLLIIDFLTNRWMMVNSRSSFWDAMASGTVWHTLFALIIMPSELYLQVVRVIAKRSLSDAKITMAYKFLKAIIWAMIVYDFLATLYPPVASTFNPSDIASTIGGILIGLLLAGLTTLASWKFIEQTFIVLQIARTGAYK